jgi:hypothetical protein
MQTGLDGVNQYHIRRRREQQGASSMSKLSSWLLLAFRAQTLRLPMKAVSGRRQMAVVANFLQALFQGLHLLLACKASLAVILNSY